MEEINLTNDGKEEMMRCLEKFMKADLNNSCLILAQIKEKKMLLMSYSNIPRAITFLELGR